VPDEGDSLDSDRGRLLVLAERHAKILEGDINMADVSLQYNHVLDGPYQDLIKGNQFGIVYGKTRGSLTQVNTNFYTGFDGVDRQITTQHRFSQNDTHFPTRTVIQGGEVSVEVPQANFQLQGFIDTNQPQTIELFTEGHTNLTDFLDCIPDRWLCTECQYEITSSESPTDPTKARYAFKFEFQYKKGGWQPGVSFIDPRTNRPPVGLVPGVNQGYWRVPYYLGFDFTSFFAQVEQI
jgi:hypothetical protein